MNLANVSCRTSSSSLYNSGDLSDNSLYSSMDLSPSRSRWSSSSSGGGGSLRSPAPAQYFAAPESYFSHPTSCDYSLCQAEQQQQLQLQQQQQQHSSSGLVREVEANSPWFIRNIIELSKLRLGNA
jgi:hypothetical protein